MADNPNFLSDLPPRPWSPPARYGFSSARLFVGHGALGLEVAVAHSGRTPKRSDVLEVLEDPQGRTGGARVARGAASGRRRPVRPGWRDAAGPSGGGPGAKSNDSVTRRSHSRTGTPRFVSCRKRCRLWKRLFSGLNNEGLLALHELQHGVPARADWTEAGHKAKRVLGARDHDLLGALGFRIERLDNLTSLLRRADRRTALAVLLRDTESPEAGTDRFNGLSPISYGLKKADDEDLPWVVLVQGNRLRLYATAVETGVGRRGRTETYVECQPPLLSDDHLPYLWLLFSADALAPDGSLRDVLDESRRFAGGLADRLRERIYEQSRSGSGARDLGRTPSRRRRSRQPGPDVRDGPHRSCSGCSSSRMPKTATCSRTDTTTPIAAGP